MQTKSLLAALALSGTAFSFPLSSLIARASTWTIQSFTRTCNVGDTLCTYSFGINRNDGSATTPCNYNVSSTTTNNASTASYSTQCVDYAVSSSWSGQFGPGNGFQTLAVKYNSLIIFPAYQDVELVNNTAVSPDKSYTPQPFQQAVQLSE